MTDLLLEDPTDIRADDPRLAFNAVAATVASCAPATPPPWFDLRQEVLSVDAMTDLCMTIGRFGDHITPKRRFALRQLLTRLVEQALGVNTGRYAYGLPCGAGKTQAIVALMASIQKLGLPISIAVSASTIKALCLIKRDLLRAGVPEQLIGLRFGNGKSLAELRGELEGESIPPEAMANTGDDDRQFMLVSHAHVRGGEHGTTFAHHKGKPRNLLIWDESFFSAKAGALSMRELELARGALTVDIPPGTPLQQFLATAIERIEADLAAQKAGAKPAIIDLLPGTDHAAARQQAAAANRCGEIAAAVFGAIDDLLSLADRELSVALTGDGTDALIHYTVAVSPEWQNIAVLDASIAIRLLARGGSVADRTTDEMRECRTYENVVVRQLLIAASKTTQRSDVAKVARAVAAILGDLGSRHPEWRVLLVTFKATKGKLLATLRKEGIDLDAKVNGKPRISVLTFGQETSTNAYSDHEAVLLAGVLRRSYSDLAASSAGEAGSILHRDGASGLRELQVSESAHNTLQAIHRGQCRKTDAEGRALPMDVYIIDNEAGLRDVLMPVLPGVTWDISTPADAVGGGGRTKAAAEAVVSYLSGLPATVRSVSIRKLKEAVAATSEIALGDDQWRTAINRALDGRRLLAGLTHPADQAWHRVGRSVER